MRTKLTRLSAALAVALLVASSVLPSAADARKTKNVKALDRFRFRGGLELDFRGRFVYASQWNGYTDRFQNPGRGGVRIFRTNRKGTRRVGFLHCPGADNDVAVVKRGFIAIGYAQNNCGHHSSEGNGVLIADVRRPRSPRVVGDVVVFGAHTISKYPGEPYIYASPAGFNNTGQEDIVDVSDPANPKLVASFETPGFACHDIGFDIRPDRKLAFCPQVGGGEVQIWDVSDPVAPQVVGNIVNSSIQYGHSALASPDGEVLAITDEAWVSHDCTSGESPTGRLWFYDISDPTLPVLLGSFAPPRGKEGAGTIAGWIPSYCTSALLDWVPGTRYLLATWYTGGTNVLDLSDPAAPAEVAFYRPRKTLAYGIGWHRGRVFVNDITRGVEVLRIRGLR